MIFEILKSIDVYLFFLINHGIKNSFFDKFFVFITETKNFYILFIVLFLFLIIFGRSKGRICVSSVIIGLTISDFISSKILKHLFLRPRPFEVLPEIYQLVSAGSRLSFPSSHAVNSFTVATIFFLFYKTSWDKRYVKTFFSSYWVGIISYIWAGLSAISRVYVGVHYPIDVIFSSLLGILIGHYVYIASIYLSRKFSIFTSH